ncbi:AraC family transcriptional regulator [Phocaeicola barnesiae]
MAMKNMKYIKWMFLLISLQMIVACNIFEDKNIRIGFSQCTGGEWREQMNKEILSEAKFYDNVDIIIKNASGDIQQQIDDIKYLVSENVDLLIISPLEDSILIDEFNNLDFQNIPVLLVDRKISSNKYVSYVGASNWDIGVKAANYVLMKRGDQKTNIIHIKGYDKSTATLERESGFINTLRGNPNMLVSTIVSGQDLGGKNIESTVNILKQKISVLKTADVIYAYNDAIAIAVYDILKNAGIDEIPMIIGVDGMFGYMKGINAVKDGMLTASIVYPTGGAKVIDVGMKIINHISVPKENLLPSILVDCNNVRSYYLQGQDIMELNQKINLLQDEKNRFKNKYFQFKTSFYVSIGILVILIGIGIYLFWTVKKKSASREWDFLEYEQLNLDDKGENFEELVLGYIQENYMNYDCELTSLIDKLAMSRIAFYRQFKLNFKDTPNNYLKQYRLNKAKELILENKYTYAEIGYKVGFSSPAYFTKCFKEEFNLTPSQYFEKKNKKNFK